MKKFLLVLSCLTYFSLTFVACWMGSHSKYEMDWSSFNRFHSGSDTCFMPDCEKQSAGFYHLYISSSDSMKDVELPIENNAAFSITYSGDGISKSVTYHTEDNYILITPMGDGKFAISSGTTTTPHTYRKDTGGMLYTANYLGYYCDEHYADAQNILYSDLQAVWKQDIAYIWGNLLFPATLLLPLGLLWIYLMIKRMRAGAKSIRNAKLRAVKCISTENRTNVEDAKKEIIGGVILIVFSILPIVWSIVWLLSEIPTFFFVGAVLLFLGLWFSGLQIIDIVSASRKKKIYSAQL